jgi:transposase-like protein
VVERFAIPGVIETGKPIAEVARDLGVNHDTLSNWMKAWRHANPELDPAISRQWLGCAWAY